MEEKAADETESNWRGELQWRRNREAAGRIGSGSIRLRVIKLFFETFIVFKYSKFHNKSMVNSCYLIAAPGWR